MGWKAANNRHVENDRLVLKLKVRHLESLSLRDLYYHPDIQRLLSTSASFCLLHPNTLKIFPKSKENHPLFIFARTHPQIVSRALSFDHPLLPEGVIILPRVVAIGFEVTADGEELFPWSALEQYPDAWPKNITFASVKIKPLNNNGKLSEVITLEAEYGAREIKRKLIGHIFSLNEKLSFTLKCNVKDSNGTESEGELEFLVVCSSISTNEESLLGYEAYRGEMVDDTRLDLEKDLFDGDERFILAQQKSFKVEKNYDNNEDTVFMHCSDEEIFPVKKILLRPCLTLTSHIHIKNSNLELSSQFRNMSIENKHAGFTENFSGIKDKDSAKAQEKSCIWSNQHDLQSIEVHIPIECCAFDRVLLFLEHLHSNKSTPFKIGLEYVREMLESSRILKILALEELCLSLMGEQAARIRSDKLKYDEIKRRNSSGEVLLLIDGLIYDATKWLPEHPGGKFIIPTQALNIDATVFFELYHASTESFLYLTQLFIGILDPDEVPKFASVKDKAGKVISPSKEFLAQLRELTEPLLVKSYKSL